MTKLNIVMISLIKVPPYSKLNFQEKISSPQNWCNITLSKQLLFGVLTFIMSCRKCIQSLNTLLPLNDDVQLCHWCSGNRLGLKSYRSKNMDGTFPTDLNILSINPIFPSFNLSVCENCTTFPTKTLCLMKIRWIRHQYSETGFSVCHSSGSIQLLFCGSLLYNMCKNTCLGQGHNWKGYSTLLLPYIVVTT
jgi:hypothetical protein